MEQRHLFTAVLPARRLVPLADERPPTSRQPMRIRAILDGLRRRRSPFEEPAVMTTAEVAECGCPDWCDRDHEVD